MPDRGAAALSLVRATALCASSLLVVTLAACTGNEAPEPAATSDDAPASQPSDQGGSTPSDEVAQDDQAPSDQQGEAEAGSIGTPCEVKDGSEELPNQPPEVA